MTTFKARAPWPCSVIHDEVRMGPEKRGLRCTACMIFEVPALQLQQEKKNTCGARDRQAVHRMSDGNEAEERSRAETRRRSGRAVSGPRDAGDQTQKISSPGSFMLVLLIRDQRGISGLLMWD